jgi:hypothetical protein
MQSVEQVLRLRCRILTHGWHDVHQDGEDRMMNIQMIKADH